MFFTKIIFLYIFNIALKNFLINRKKKPNVFFLLHALQNILLFNLIHSKRTIMDNGQFYHVDTIDVVCLFIHILKQNISPYFWLKQASFLHQKKFGFYCGALEAINPSLVFPNQIRITFAIGLEWVAWHKKVRT